MPSTSIKLLRFLYQASRGMSLLVALAGFLSGVLSAGLVALINTALHHEGITSKTLVLAFAALALGKIGTNALSQALLLRFAQRTVLELCLDLCKKITASPFRRMEIVGTSRILTTLTDDLLVIAGAIQTIPSLTINLAVLVGCSVYLAWLSWTVFLGMLAMTLLGALIYKLLHARAFEAIYRARESRDRLLGHFRALTEGLKELKLHKARRDAFVSKHIQSTAEHFQHHNLIAGTQYGLLEGWTQLMFYGMIGILLFSLPALEHIPAEALTGYVFAALYMMNPIWGIIGALPTFYRGQVSLKKLEDLGISLSLAAADENPPVAPNTVRQWESLDLDGVEFGYRQEGIPDNDFSLGPITLSLRPGEIMFVVGGNGSGKSTFVKLLTGLYVPQAGKIYMGGALVSDDNREWYRQHFSVVFSDFYLFDDLLGLTSPDVDAEARKYLAVLQLAEKVTVSQGKLSTTALSHGQRKRLALLTAYLENRPIYVFDEWAADQDPQYKEIFYMQLLPELRAKGKAVVVVTHDDRYFHLGDQVIKLDSGRVVGIWSQPDDGLVNIYGAKRTSTGTVGEGGFSGK